MAAKVFFTKEITPESIKALYSRVCEGITGKVAVKLHSGEKGNQNFLPPELWKNVIDSIGGTVVECNTAYEGSRNTTEAHRRTMEEHGWSKHFTVDIMDAEGPDCVLEIPRGKVIKKNYVGKNLTNYDSLVVLSHFKGHPMGGYGGALKQLSIGIASSFGKQYIHGAGVPESFWTAERNDFLDSMADAALSVTEHFGSRACYINVMKNLTVDCDCCSVAEDPCMADIGEFLDCREKRLFGFHGRRRSLRHRTLRKQSLLYQRHEEPDSGLRLLLRCGGPLHGGYRRACLHGPGGDRPCLP